LEKNIIEILIIGSNGFIIQNMNVINGKILKEIKMSFDSKKFKNIPNNFNNYYFDETKFVFLTDSGVFIFFKNF
jgi:hypothetical protein